MKGKLLVYLFSFITIGLFAGCCYLMTIVNPQPLPQAESRKYNVGDDMYPRESQFPRDNPDYGLEKIPEGVDADEFRKVMIEDNKNVLNTEPISSEPGKRVVPPVWPSYKGVETSEDKRNVKDLTSRPKIFETTSPVKGHRRSVNDNKLREGKESPGSILLKIVDDSGHKKVEIKFIAADNIQEEKLRKNATDIEKNKNIQLQNNNDINEKIIQIKGLDVMLFSIVDDLDIVLDKSALSYANNTEIIQKVATNTTVSNYVNKTTISETKLVDLDEPQKKPNDEVIQKGRYTLNLLFNSENKTNDSGNLNIQKYSSTTLAVNKDRLNNTNVFNEVL